MNHIVLGLSIPGLTWRVIVVSGTFQGSTHQTKTFSTFYKPHLSIPHHRQTKLLTQNTYQTQDHWRIWLAQVACPTVYRPQFPYMFHEKKKQQQQNKRKKQIVLSIQPTFLKVSDKNWTKHHINSIWEQSAPFVPSLVPVFMLYFGLFNANGLQMPLMTLPKEMFWDFH